jgi:protease II
MSKAASTGSTNPVVAMGMGVFALATSLYVYHKRQQRFVPPVAKRVEHKVEIGSHTHKDDLYWIRDDERKAPPVIRLLEKENVYSAAMMEHTTGLQDKLYKEYLSHLKEDDSEVPYKHGPYQYYRVTTKGLNYPRYCRKLAVDGAKTIANNSNPEQTVLDVNALAAGHVFCSVVGVSPSPDHNLLAYAVSARSYLCLTFLLTQYKIIGGLQRDGESSLHSLYSAPLR